MSLVTSAWTLVLPWPEPRGLSSETLPAVVIERRTPAPRPWRMHDWSRAGRLLTYTQVVSAPGGIAGAWDWK